MTPTPEQLEAVAKALRDPWDKGLLGGDCVDIAECAWNIIAPIVRAQALEEAAKVIETEGKAARWTEIYATEVAEEWAERIRALK